MSWRSTFGSAARTIVNAPASARSSGTGSEELFPQPPFSDLPASQHPATVADQRRPAHGTDVVLELELISHGGGEHTRMELTERLDPCQKIDHRPERLGIRF